MTTCAYCRNRRKDDGKKCLSCGATQVLWETDYSALQGLNREHASFAQLQPWMGEDIGKGLCYCSHDDLMNLLGGNCSPAPH